MPIQRRNRGSRAARKPDQTGVKFPAISNRLRIIPVAGTSAATGAFASCQRIGGISQAGTMSFPWPVTDDELVLDEALDIALRYFDLPQDEAQYATVESFAGEAIMAEWRRGVRNKVVLANKAVAEIEKHHPLRKKLSPVS